MLFKHLSPENRALIRELRSRGERSKRRRKPGRRNGYVTLWNEQDIVNGKITESLVVVLRTSGCSWGKKANCSMCGYFVDSSDSSTVREQFNSVLDRQENHRFLKIYTSGSFLDPGEIPKDILYDLLKEAGDHFDRVLIESRPEFVTPDTLKDIKDLAELEIAIGLESADNEVLMHSINKGFTFQDYLRAGEFLRSRDIPLRTYLLLKPPFMTEGEAIRSAKESISKVEDLSETISINPMNIQNFTFVEHLFRKGNFHPPSLWSLLEVLKTPSRSRLISAPSGGGTRRGVHNCGNCDKPILESIREFSLYQDPVVLDHSCSCREEWLDLIALEDAVQVPLP